MRHGSHLDPPNRFKKTHLEPDLEQVEEDDSPLDKVMNLGKPKNPIDDKERAEPETIDNDPVVDGENDMGQQKLMTLQCTWMEAKVSTSLSRFILLNFKRE